jgi:hypothetical protein
MISFQTTDLEMLIASQTLRGDRSCSQYSRNIPSGIVRETQLPFLHDPPSTSNSAPALERAAPFMAQLGLLPTCGRLRLPGLQLLDVRGRQLRPIDADRRPVQPGGQRERRLVVRF